MTRPSDEFYVGYAGAGPRTRRFLLIVGLGLLLAAVGLAALIARTQSDPGEGLKPQTGDRSFRGVMMERPYPHLRYLDEKGEVDTLLFVSGGKSGIDAQNGGGSVSVNGFLFERDGTRMLAAPRFEKLDAIEAPWLPRLRALPDEELGETVLEGEIVDSKCYLGAMRPGRGPTHRACAQMCISGGVPPLLIVEDESGRELHVLLASREGGPVNELVLPFVAEPVRIRGRLRRRAGLLVLEFDARDLDRS